MQCNSRSILVEGKYLKKKLSMNQPFNMSFCYTTNNVAACGFQLTLIL